ncbi:7494_t:CDS:2 [Entrophospora sp. SA101]|nr:7494_t:CDS:2 [Entrophospora sp. SA101]
MCTNDDKPLIGKIPWLDGVYIVKDENGNIINVPGTNRSSRSSIIVKDEDGNVINLDDVNPDDIRRSITIVEDENGNVINIP